jgi:hemoglobin
MNRDHPRYVAMWLGEVFGGPPRYTEERGGYPHMMQKHLNRALIAVANSQPGASPPPRAPVPRWGWGEAPPYNPG